MTTRKPTKTMQQRPKSPLWDRLAEMEREIAALEEKVRQRTKARQPVA